MTTRNSHFFLFFNSGDKETRH